MAEQAGPKWTPEQEQAIEARGCDLLVAAAAGSGKTATLVERVIRRLTDPKVPIDVDQLLVVTFTEAAATEMRDRIGAALQRALEADPENARLQRQIALLGRAAISTLHSFCLGLIRQYFYRLGLDPAVAVMGEHEALLLRHEVLDDLLGRHFGEEPDGPFYALVDRYGGGRGDEGLRELVLSLYDYAQSLPWPDRWLAESLNRFAVPADARIDDLPWWPPLRRQMRLELSRARADLQEAERLTHLPAGPEAYGELLAREAALVGAAAEAEGWQELSAAMAAITFDRLPAVRKGSVDEALQDRVKGLRDEGKKRVKALAETYFGRSEAEWLADLRAVEPHLRTLVELVQEFAAAFREAKAAESAVDFTDLERFALQLLRSPDAAPGRLEPSDVARELRTRYAEILVDEYQDINGVQDAILSLVARDGSDGAPNRFMVGDVKQSIYRFRHADPSLFLGKYRAYGPWRGPADLAGSAGTDAVAAAGEAAGGEEVHPAPAGRRIVLGANFRSRAGVVDAVNLLFRQIMTASVGELDYDRDAELVCRAGFPPRPGEGEPADRPAGPPVELHLLDRTAPGDAGPVEEEPEAGGQPEAESQSSGRSLLDELADLRAVEREARLVAQRIREMVAGGEEPPVQVWDRQLGAYRPLRYRDIVILMRATTGRANTYLEVLTAAGIPAHAQLATGYFAATEVEVMLSLLQLLDNPHQDIPLAAVLRSPIVGLSNADLARIRVAVPEGSFYDALVGLVGRTDPAEPEEPQAVAEAVVAEAAAASEQRERRFDGGLDEVAVTLERPVPGALAGSALGEVLRGFAASLDRWRTLARRRPLSQVIWQIYQETHYLHYATAMPGGPQRQANLLALYERARQFDQFARQGLFRFLRFIERIRAAEADMGAALALGEGEDVVRLMSIHKSKGLEFPVVFVTGLGSAFARQDLSGDLLLQHRLGFGPQLVDPEQRAKYPTLAYYAVREATRLETLAEELRVLYVALTRARERLILVGSVRGLPERCARWARAAGAEGWQLPDPLLAGADSYLDWIGPALVRHPDAGPVREAGGIGQRPLPPSPVAADPSQWQVRIWDVYGQQALLAVGANTADEEPLDWERIGAAQSLELPYDPAVGDELSRRFSWRYPYEPLVSRFGKLSVTELKGRFDPDAEEPLPEAAPLRRNGSLPRSPRFLQEQRKSLTPTERGTLMHLVLQHLDLKGALDGADVAAQVAALVEREVITSEEAAAVETGAIASFFASPLGQRIRQRPEGVRRELSFTLALPAAEVYTDIEPALTEGEVVIIQGMIDLLLEEEDGFVLVDYKTDRRAPEEAAKRYGVQIAAYRRAVEEILGRPVKEAYLHFLAANQTVAVPRSPVA